MKHNKYFLAILIFLFAFSFLYTEDFRIGKLHIANIQTKTDYSYTEEININDAIAIFVPEQRQYLDGIEIKFELPEEVALQKSSLEFSIYDKVTPLPKDEQINYSGNKIFRAIVPSKLSWIVQIPLIAQNTFKSNQYTTKIGQIPDLKDNTFLIRLQNLIPSLSSEVSSHKVKVNIKPIFSNKGRLLLHLKCPDENAESCTIYIDDYAFNINTLSQGILLESGIHNISVLSEFYRTEVRKFRIDKTKETELSITMKSIEPTILITAPGGIKVYIDNEVCNYIGKEKTISEGTHKVSCSLGDYEVIRSINIIKGKSYKINISVDLQVHEE